MSAEVADPVKRFIVDSISSVVQLEALLLLRASERAWTVDELSRELRIDRDGVAAQLDPLVDAVLARDPAAVAYRYQPQSAAVASVIDALAAGYAERRVTIIGLIYSKPAESIRVFADAFRIRGNDKN